MMNYSKGGIKVVLDKTSKNPECPHGKTYIINLYFH